MTEDAVSKIMEITNTEILYELILANQEHLTPEEQSKIEQGINLGINIHYYTKLGLIKSFRRKGNKLYLHGQYAGTLLEYYEEETRRKALMKKILFEALKEGEEPIKSRY